MKETTLDCNGLPCPQPVLKTKKCVESERPDRIVVLVDNPAAHENVTRFLASCNYLVEPGAGADRVVAAAPSITGDDATATPMTEEEIMASCPITGGGGKPAEKIAVFITSDVMGRGDDELGTKLMKNFLLTLQELGDTLWRIVMVNAGVRFAVEGSDSLETLKALEASGVDILVCGTCLEFFGLLEHKRVGVTTNMLDVVTSLANASKVIKI
jgi:selenium metabolism protein YedF